MKWKIHPKRVIHLSGMSNNINMNKKCFLCIYIYMCMYTKYIMQFAILTAYFSSSTWEIK